MELGATAQGIGRPGTVQGPEPGSRPPQQVDRVTETRRAACGIPRARPGQGRGGGAPQDQGGYRPPEDREWYASPDVRAHLDGKGKRNSGLSHNEADASLGVRSFGAIILTNEKKGKAGPLALAAKHSGHVLYLEDLEGSGLNLKDFVSRARHRRLSSSVSRLH